MATTLRNQPVFILSEDAQRTRGRDARTSNLMAGRAVAEAVRTTLGPRGMDKMLIDTSGNVVITNDGVTILREMDVVHPAAEMIVEVAKTQEDETGDGTTTAAILAGELLRLAEDLLDQNVHASTVGEGYRLAAAEAKRVLEEMATDATDDEELLTQIAMTAMTGKGAESARHVLAPMIVAAVQAVADDEGIDLDDVAVEPVVGGGVDESELIEGVVLDKERLHPDMPASVDDPKIAVFDGAIEVKSTSVDSKINVTSPDQLDVFLQREESEIADLIQTLVDAGATVVFAQKKIDDMAKHYLAKAGILAVKRVKKSDVGRIARATGARIVSDPSSITAEDLGSAGRVGERTVGGETRLFVEDCPNARSVTLLLRGGTEHVVDELERAIEDGLGAVRTTALDGMILPGGGAPEVAAALRVREYADSIPGRQQLAVEAFADALEIVPRTLAENAGLDRIDTMVRLRAKHDRGEDRVGLNAQTGAVEDLMALGVVEPLRVKTQAIDSAVEVTDLILRIDDVIAA